MIISVTDRRRFLDNLSNSRISRFVIRVAVSLSAVCSLDTTAIHLLDSTRVKQYTNITHL